MHTSVVHRLLATLQAHHYVEQISESGKYRVGLKAYEMGPIYMNTTNLITEGRLVLMQLVEVVD